MRMLAVSLLVLLLHSLQPASAAIFVVNSLSDDNAGDSNPGDGICEDIRGGTRCTLRAAIEEANTTGAFDTINFNVGSFFVINLESPLPSISTFMSIDGRTEAGYNTAATDISQAPPRVYLNGSALAGTASADGVRLTNGATASAIHALGLINFPDAGIEVFNADAVEIKNCWIGLAANGALAGNGRGIFLNQAERAIVGQHINGSGQVIGLGNVISSNTGDGIYVLVGEENLIAGNRIGTAPDGLSNRGNGGDGIELVAPNNEIGTSRGLVGGGLVRAGNLIAYNAGYGVNAALGGQQIETNDIRGNGLSGVLLAGTGSNVGFTNADLQANSIHGNAGAGVRLAGSAHLVQNNAIYQNTGRGIEATGGSDHDLVQNRIYGNGSDGVRVASSTTEVRNNDIGRNNTTLAPNLGEGVLLEGGNNLVTNNRIGGAPGGLGDGIDVRAGNNNGIRSNDIGTVDAANIGNGGFGIRIGLGVSATVIDGNRIGFNAGGISLLGSGARVCGNRIGASASGGAAGNFVEGIFVAGSAHLIGASPLGCAGNEIVHNGSSGMILRGSGHFIADNSIGRVAGGNASGGIRIDAGAEDNQIIRNMIAHNTGDGVRVAATAGDRNRIEDNAFSHNTDTGIDLGDDGITPNDSGDGDIGPNELQNHPDWLGPATSPAAGQVMVNYWVNSTMANSAFPIAVHFYLSGTGARQGLTHLHTASYTVVGVSRFATMSLPAGVSGGTLTALAIDNLGNTSEFSEPLAFTGAPLIDDIFKNGFEAP